MSPVFDFVSSVSNLGRDMRSTWLLPRLLPRRCHLHDRSPATPAPSISWPAQEPPNHRRHDGAERDALRSPSLTALVTTALLTIKPLQENKRDRCCRTFFAQPTQMITDRERHFGNTSNPWAGLSAGGSTGGRRAAVKAALGTPAYRCRFAMHSSGVSIGVQIAAKPAGRASSSAAGDSARGCNAMARRVPPSTFQSCEASVLREAAAATSASWPNERTGFCAE
jgi:hypothetical protein